MLPKEHASIVCLCCLFGVSPVTCSLFCPSPSLALPFCFDAAVSTACGTTLQTETLVYVHSDGFRSDVPRPVHWP